MPEEPDETAAAFIAERRRLALGAIALGVFLRFVVGRAPVVVTRPRVEAADQRNDSLFAVRAALRRAYAVQQSAVAQVDQLRRLVERLEAERRRRD